MDNQLIGSPIGETVELRCMVEAYPTAITYWVKNGPNGREEMLLNRPKYTIEEQKFTYKVELKMTIDEFTKEDEGVYTCTSTNSLGIKESTVRVYEMARRTTAARNSSPSPPLVWTTNPAENDRGQSNVKTNGGPKGDMKNKLYYNSNLKHVNQDSKRLSTAYESNHACCLLPVDRNSMMLLFLLFTLIISSSC